MEDVVLADSLHRCGPLVVLAGLRRKAVDTLVCQLDRGRRGHFVHARMDNAEFRAGRLDQLVRHHVVVDEPERRAGRDHNREVRPLRAGADRPHVTAPHLVADRDGGRATGGRCRGERKCRQGGESEWCEANRALANHHFSNVRG